MEKSDEWRSKISQRGNFLRKTGQWADCYFLVGKEEGQAQFQCHKLLLSLASPVFEAMFYGSMAEATNPIKVPDVQPDAFKVLLDYIYTDEVNMTNCQKVCELWYTAKKYMLPVLVSICVSYLSSNAKPENVCIIYEYADLFEEPTLVKKCLNIMRTRTKEVITGISFRESKLNTVVTLFSLDNLNITSELDLFDATMQYKNAQQHRDLEITNKRDNQNVDMCVKEEKVSESVNKFNVKSVLEKIRFLTLTAEQFASGITRNSGLLTEMESHAILMNILMPNTAKLQLPTGFSSARIKRNKTKCVSSTPTNPRQTKQQWTEDKWIDQQIRMLHLIFPNNDETDRYYRKFDTE